MYVDMADMFMVVAFWRFSPRLFSMGSAAESLEDLCGRSLNAHPSRPPIT